ncbi:MAG: hypothetical protein R3C99_01900 [Pirellulaceae bacterium]
MDDLGLPFEQFTHYGLHRDAELVEDEATSRKRLHRNGEPIKQFHPQSLDTTGVID